MLLSVCLPPALLAQEDDVFAFIPDGGRTLLGKLIDGGKVDSAEVVATRRSEDEWLGFLRGLSGSGLDDTQMATLAAYLASSMPAAEHAGKTIETAGRQLPRDGRDLTLEYCQSCHIITVVITQDRSREAWLGTMNKPSHVEIDTTQAERKEIADYLILNGGISIEDVPEELRAGGATY
ncbi:MAG: hypothetical protein Q8Q62_09675 [Mesorhizobium sp.]|nr:hypothetical protein [Mesorhizobium sp.]